MAECLFGMETEYAATAIGHDGVPLPSCETCGRLLTVARCRYPHANRLESSSLFLGNGGCFYVDEGCHPEMATPECATPWDLVRYVLAGERILARLAEDLVAGHQPVAQTILLKSNVDYASLTTWGTHESYNHRIDPVLLPKQIVPHFVSRIVYTGAGGFKPEAPAPEFMLSPRVPFLARTVSSYSTYSRGIFHTKDEPLCRGGYNRLHVLCGESLCSQTATWLKVGATALIVAMIEAGLRPGDEVGLAAPLKAMWAFAKDATCSVTAELTSGRRATAVEIQRHYLDMAETCVGESFMPVWAGEVVRVWRAILDRLEQGAPDSVATTLDWAIKFVLYRDRVRRLDIDGDDLRPWPCEELKSEFCEIDSRFGQLGGRGIFDAMDRAGVLDHAVPGVGQGIADAIDNPPAVGRARLRGKCIKELSGKGHELECAWHGVLDFRRHRFLNLWNPFETEERWEEWCDDEDSDGLRDPRELLSSRGAPRVLRRTPEGFREGDRVILQRPSAADRGGHGISSMEWVSFMDRYVGRPATITQVLRIGRAGHSLVMLDFHGRCWTTLTRNLRRVAEESPSAATEASHA